MEAVFVRILNMSIAAVWLILLIVVFKVVFRKVPKSLHCLLWIAVAIRLICPFYFEAPEWFFDFIPNNKPITDEILIDNENYSRQSFLIAELNDNTHGTAQEYTQAAVEKKNINYEIVHIVSKVWVVGIVLILGYSVISYLRLKMKVRESVRFVHNIWRCDHVNTPFIIGIFAPRIIIPSSMDEDDIEYVVAHEMTHLDRKDNLWKALAVLLLAIYWINPLMWVAYILFCRDIEFACDDKVVYCKTEEYIKGYMRALVKCSVPKYKSVTYSVAFGEINVKRRIKRIVTRKKPYIFMAELIIIMLFALCCSFFVLQPAQGAAARWRTKTVDDMLWESIGDGIHTKFVYPGIIPTTEGGKEEITYEEFISICANSKDVCLEDFAEYKYVLVDGNGVEMSILYEGNANDGEMRLPLAGYEDMYAMIDYCVYSDGSIGMIGAYLCECGYSISGYELIDRMMFYASTQVEQKCDDRTMYVDIVAGSITDDSMVVKVFNNTGETYIWDYSYEIYEVCDGEEVLVASKKGVRRDCYSVNIDYTKELKLEEGEKFEEGKQYLLKYGKNKPGCIYGEIMFVK